MLNAMKWWSSLSINEQKKFTAMHPFFGKMDSMYIIQHKTGIVQLYTYLVDNHLIDQVVSANDLCGLDQDNEDQDIYDRRCYESDRRMTDY